MGPETPVTTYNDQNGNFQYILYQTNISEEHLQTRKFVGSFDSTKVIEYSN